MSNPPISVRDLERREQALDIRTATERLAFYGTKPMSAEDRLERLQQVEARMKRQTEGVKTWASTSFR